MAEDVSTAKIADNTEGFSGSDLRQLCTAAAMCGIRELMKATSKSSKDKAAAKQVRRAAKHGAVSDSSTTTGAAADTAGPSQQHNNESYTGKVEESASISEAGQQSQPAEDASAIVPATAADEPSASSASAVADQAKQQAKQGIGTKRDIDEDSSGSGIKQRSKATTDDLDSADKTGTQSSSARGAEAEQSDAAGTNNSAATSTSSPIHAAGSTATSQQLPNQQHADSSTQKTCPTIDWLLAKYKEVAAAADQQVHKLAILVLCCNVTCCPLICRLAKIAIVCLVLPGG